MKQFKLIVLAFLVFLVLPACAGGISLHSVINIASIETVLGEDGSGSNTFMLVVPNRSDCDLLDLRPALENFKTQTNTPIYFANYEDNEYKGFRLTYEFQSTEQIPEQIDRLKRAVVDTAIAAVPTPQSTLEVLEVQQPTPSAVGLYYAPEQLSLSIAPPVTTLTGQTWEVRVNITPFLWTGLTTEHLFMRVLPESCSVPRFTYDLTMPGEIKSFQVSTEPNWVKFSNVEPTGPNSIQWTLESKQAFDEVWINEFELFIQELEESTPSNLDEQAEKIASEELQAKLEQRLKGPAYTLTVTSTTPSPLFQTLTRVVAPVVGLIGAVLAVILSVIKIRQSRKKVT